MHPAEEGYLHFAEEDTLHPVVEGILHCVVVILSKVEAGNHHLVEHLASLVGLKYISFFYTCYIIL